MKITPIILAGGGARLWPLSTPARPKPLLCLFGDRTLLQATVYRFRDQSRFRAPVLSVGQACR
jgi:mannose-1-phosphate guanylyltransferase/mannose-1-phosphate guanylyltransferase/mannose-6-phosphate isomerase